MGNLTAYKCLECGHFTISKYDGIRCAKCGGPTVPVGKATYIDKTKGMAVNVNIKDTECNLFKSIDKLSLNDDDIVIIKVNAILPDDTLNEIGMKVKDQLKISNKVLVIGNEYDIKVEKAMKG